MFPNISVILLLVLLPLFGQAANILAIFPISCKSHMILLHKLMKTLVANGHRVTVLSGMPLSTPVENYTDIDLSSQLEPWSDFMHYSDLPNVNGAWGELANYTKTEAGYFEAILSSNFMQNLLNNKHDYDLLMVETYRIHAFFVIAAKLDIPAVWIICSPGDSSVDFTLGNPITPSYVPVIVTKYGTKMNFFERIHNTMEYMIMYFSHYVHARRISEKLIKEYIGEDGPTLDQGYDKVSIAIVNSHQTLATRPTLLSTVDIGGFHISDHNPLSQELRTIIENSEHGTIYFSLGSVIKASSLPKRILSSFSKAFSNLNQTIIWRIDDPSIVEVSENTITGKWFPQHDILGHNNVKLFISHCGAMSTYETIHTRIPVLCIPLYYDQFTNAMKIKEKGCGMVLEIDKVTEQLLYDTIIKMLYDKRFKMNMNSLSDAFLDQPMTPKHKILYWVDYVIRHKGADHLKCIARSLPAYQYLLLDVAFFAFVFVIIVILLTFIAIRLVRLTIYRLYMKSYSKEKLS